MKAIKKFTLLISVVFFMLLIFSACGTHTTDGGMPPLLRLHIRANSNSAADQAVKLVVRDKVTAFLESELSEVSDYETAKTEISKRLSRIKKLADEVLAQEGFSYKCAAELKNEFFPARSYEGYVVESGYYDAVIINLGSGTGDNWWCVIYPPLCYTPTGDSGVVYKSKVFELFGGCS